MELFGLSTSEAILLTRQLSAEQERRKNETLRAVSQQQAALEQQSEADRKTQLETIGQIGTEARQLEPFITMQLVGESYTPISDTVSIRPSDIREFKRLDASYDTEDYDNPMPFGYYKKTIHRPYTAIVLWSTKQINVVDTVEQIQEKIQQNIEHLCKIQAQILADAARKED